MFLVCMCLVNVCICRDGCSYVYIWMCIMCGDQGLSGIFCFLPALSFINLFIHPSIHLLGERERDMCEDQRITLRSGLSPAILWYPEMKLSVHHTKPEIKSSILLAICQPSALVFKAAVLTGLGTRQFSL